MCETCGCSIPGHEHPEPADTHTVEVLKGLMSSNDHAAAHNREHFDRSGVLVVNLMSSPGAGKTRLLEQTAAALGDRLNIAVIEGDLETENDAERLRRGGIRAHQITTGSACHLDAHLIHQALHEFPLADQGKPVDVLFIENVGNLVCPAAFDLGQHLNVVLLSTTEGDDKPAKYPVMFRAADLVMLSKCDLLPLLDDFSVDRARSSLEGLGRQTPVIQTAAGRQPDVGAWIEWLEARRAEHSVPRGKEQVAATQTA
ncbi:MAG TPA: hydrogenase nickel incorporation protein HypB [Wenzhouxiangellaceae bacterium]|nr:hydrogenase nickel incorporation protein HypB [Wenzhouxiangellaceae bacterium]